MCIMNSTTTAAKNRQREGKRERDAELIRFDHGNNKLKINIIVKTDTANDIIAQSTLSVVHYTQSVTPCSV